MFGGAGAINVPGVGSNSAPDNTEFHGLSFYERPPEGETSMDELSDACLRRLHLLQMMDHKVGVDFHIYQLPKFATEYESLLAQNGFSFSKCAHDQERAHVLEMDRVSHTALRVAFSHSREAQQWFLEQEYRLFLHRLEQLTRTQRERFYRDNGVLTDIELEKSPDNIQILQQTTPYAKDERSFFKVPFHKIPAFMVKKRQVVIQKGTAYVPGKQFTRIVATDFKTQLQNLLVLAHAQHPRIVRDPRVGPLMQMLQHAQLVTKQFDDKENKDVQNITFSNFEALLKRSFPPCMRMLVENQRQTGHLKHQGRFQLRTFFKACGITYDDHMRWWKTELLRDPNLDADKFEKGYAYDVKHAHGKVGNMKGSRAFGCASIINFPFPSAGQHHGCPFKHQSVDKLLPMLRGWGVSDVGLKEVRENIDNGKHYQLACVSCFKDLHDGSDGNGCGNHPVQYFQESCKHHQEKLSKLATPGRQGGSQDVEMQDAKPLLKENQPMFS